jgi:hypothetical protein
LSYFFSETFFRWINGANMAACAISEKAKTVNCTKKGGEREKPAGELHGKNRRLVGFAGLW